METKNADLSSLKISRTEDPQSHSSAKKIVIWVAILIAILSAGYFSINLLLEKTIEVKLITVEFQSASQSNIILTASGYVVAQRKASVASKGTGRIVYLGVVEGDEVKKDQILARIEDSDIKAQLEEAEANLKFYEADLKEAENNYKREVELFEKGLTSAQLFDRAEANYKRLLASLDIAKARISQYEVALENTIIRAPFDGTVLTKNAEIGEVVAPLGASTTSRGAVVLIADMNSLLVEADVSESNIEKIEVNRDCEIVLDAYPDKNYAGFVFKIVPTADRSKATVMVKVGFKNYDSRVLPEMSAKVLFLNEALDPLTADQKPVLVVPFSSIKQEAGKTLVYFVNNDIVEPLSISTGKRLGNNIEVTSGLQRGDKIIESVDEYITQGIKVKILN
ncbi:MAG: efflux RND transporter periplasmic adaptor subunit [Bacteroidetes bacterium]|nr:efflux RND transporter periplasmic adaptor subunit [Bacteroidota bacterium]